MNKLKSVICSLIATVLLFCSSTPAFAIEGLTSNITYYPNGGSGNAYTTYHLGDFSLEGCQFGAPAGYRFSHWSTQDGTTYSN